MRLIATVLAVGLLSACTQGYYVKHRSPISVSKHVKRLNTTACHDKMTGIQMVIEQGKISKRKANLN